MSARFSGSCVVAILFFLTICALTQAAPAFAGGADDYFREFLDQRNSDPQAFALMCGCVALIVFLALTIFGGFIWFLYFGDRKAVADKEKK